MQIERGFDYLEIYNGVSTDPFELITNMTEPLDKAEVYIPGNQILVVFHKYSNMTNTRFLAKIVRSDANVETYCSKWLDVSSGQLISPNYPNKYGPNLYCNWFIEAPEGELITFQILSLNVCRNFSYNYHHYLHKQVGGI